MEIAKKTLMIFVALLLIEPAFAQVMIKQVYPDPIVSERGGEFVEIQNTGSEEQDISGWILATQTSDTDARIPNGTILGPGARYIIADADWIANRDNMSWPDADLEDAMTLHNTEGYVELISSNSSVIDRLEWGGSLKVETGMSFYRIGGSIITAEPFVADYAAELLIEQNKSETLGFEILGDAEPKKAGVQIKLKSGEDTAVKVRLYGYSGDASIEALNKTFVLTHAGDGLEGTFMLNYTTRPGVIPVVLKADNQVFNYNVTVLETISAGIDNARLSFGAVRTGSNSSIEGDDDLLTLKPTLVNTGNVPIAVRIVGTVDNAVISYSIKGSTVNVGKKPAASRVIMPGERTAISFTLSAAKGKQNQSVRATLNLLVQATPYDS